MSTQAISAQIMSNPKSSLFTWIRTLSTKLKSAYRQRLLQSADLHKQKVNIYY